MRKQQTRRFFQETSCYAMELNYDDMCDKCKFFSDRKHSGIGRKPSMKAKPKCEQAWLINTSNGNSTKTVEFNKKINVLNAMESKGFYFNYGEKVQERHSRLCHHHRANLEITGFRDNVKDNNTPPKPVSTGDGGKLSSLNVPSEEASKAIVEKADLVNLKQHILGNSEQHILGEMTHSSVASSDLSIVSQHGNQQDVSTVVPYSTSTVSEFGTCDFLENENDESLIKDLDNNQQEPKNNGEPSERTVRFSSKKKEYEFNIPTSHAILPTHTISTWKNELSQWRVAKRKLETGRFNSSCVGRSLIGTAIATAPQSSHDCISKITPMLIGGILHSAGAPIDVSKVSSGCPSRQTLHQIIQNVAVETLLVNNNKIHRNANIYLIADKANSDKKGARSATFPKMISYTNPSSFVIEEFLLDCDSAGNSSEDAAKALKHALLKLSSDNGNNSPLDICVCGGTTDSGGGGTKHSLRDALMKEGVVSHEYRVNTCALHNLQTCFRNAIEKIFGEGGMNGTNQREFKKNAMQLLNGMFNIGSYLNADVLEQMWNHACTIVHKTIKFKPLTNPVLTRWWLVGVTAMEVDENWDVWYAVMHGIRRMQKSNTSDKNVSAIQEIAAANLNLMGMQEIRADVKFIASVCKFWVFPHFAFLQKGDPITGNVAGYQGRLMLERYFLMASDLSDCLDGKWKNHSSFQHFL